MNHLLLNPNIYLVYFQNKFHLQHHNIHKVYLLLKSINDQLHFPDIKAEP